MAETWRSFARELRNASATYRETYGTKKVQRRSAGQQIGERVVGSIPNFPRTRPGHDAAGNIARRVRDNATNAIVEFTVRARMGHETLLTVAERKSADITGSPVEGGRGFCAGGLLA